MTTYPGEPVVPVPAITKRGPKYIAGRVEGEPMPPGWKPSQIGPRENAARWRKLARDAYDDMHARAEAGDTKGAAKARRVGNDRATKAKTYDALADIREAEERGEEPPQAVLPPKAPGCC